MRSGTGLFLLFLAIVDGMCLLETDVVIGAFCDKLHMVLLFALHVATLTTEMDQTLQILGFALVLVGMACLLFTKHRADLSIAKHHPLALG